MKRSTPVVLAVDDDPNDLVFVRAAFRATGVQFIQTVSSGFEAIAYLAGEGKYSDRAAFPYPTLIISDLKMPGGDGFVLLEHLRRNPECTVVPTVILSGSQDNDDVRRAYRFGASAYHLKPSSGSELRRLVKALHDYWVMSVVPETDGNGRHVGTVSSHKLGERFN